jgi:hypothetical protein
LQVFLQIKNYPKYVNFKRKPEAKHGKEMCKPLQDLKKLLIPSQLSQPLISHSPPAGTMIQLWKSANQQNMHLPCTDDAILEFQVLHSLKDEIS